MNPTISVLMPVFNQQRYVEDAIKCILRQTVSDFEFIIVDDGSDDDTVRLIRNFDDKRIRLVQDEHNGYVSALRTAMHLARGKWLARMDSDDLCPPNRFEKQLRFLAADPECSFLTSIYGIVTPNDKFLMPPASSQWHYVTPGDITLAKRLFCDPATMYDRKKALAANYDDDLENESPLWYKLLDEGKGIVLDEPLYYVRWRLGSLSRGQFENAKELHYRVRAKYDQANIHKIIRNGNGKIDLRNEKRAVYYCVAAGDLSEARKTAYNVWRRFPLSAEAYRLVLASAGFRRSRDVVGPCQVTYSPGPKPY